MEKNRYKDPINAYTDLSLVFWNALFYNEPGSQIALDAETLKVSHRYVSPFPRTTTDVHFPFPWILLISSPPPFFSYPPFSFRFRRPCSRPNGRSVPCFQRHATHHPLPRLKRFTVPFHLFRRIQFSPNSPIPLLNTAPPQNLPPYNPVPQPQRHNAAHPPYTPPPQK